MTSGRASCKPCRPASSISPSKIPSPSVRRNVCRRLVSLDSMSRGGRVCIRRARDSLPLAGACSLFYVGNINLATLPQHTNRKDSGLLTHNVDNITTPGSGVCYNIITSITSLWPCLFNQWPPNQGDSTAAMLFLKTTGAA